MELDELRKSCHRLIDYISDVKLLKKIRKLLEHLVRSVE